MRKEGNVEGGHALAQGHRVRVGSLPENVSGACGSADPDDRPLTGAAHFPKLSLDLCDKWKSAGSRRVTEKVAGNNHTDARAPSAGLQVGGGFVFDFFVNESRI